MQKLNKKQESGWFDSPCNIYSGNSNAYRVDASESDKGLWVALIFIVVSIVLLVITIVRN